eukprot:1160095-Pelagomonas_calceolata.AAC.2
MELANPDHVTCVTLQDVTQRPHNCAPCFLRDERDNCKHFVWLHDERGKCMQSVWLRDERGRCIQSVCLHNGRGKCMQSVRLHDERGKMQAFCVAACVPTSLQHSSSKGCIESRASYFHWQAREECGGNKDPALFPFQSLDRVLCMPEFARITLASRSVGRCPLNQGLVHT